MVMIMEYKLYKSTLIMLQLINRERQGKEESFPNSAIHQLYSIECPWTTTAPLIIIPKKN